VSESLAKRVDVDGDMTSPHRRVLQVIAREDDTVLALARRETYAAARSICVLALLDALDPKLPAAGSGAAALSFVNAATAERLAVLLEPTPARDAHPIVSGLARVGLIDPGIAQQAHLLIDLRSDPG
jgi:hypothetical protein